MGTVTKGKGAIYIKTLIGIAFMYFFGLVCPTFGGMSQMGIKILGVFIGLIFMTCVGCDLFSSSLLALLAFVLHGYYKASELISGWIGSGVTFQLIFAGALCVYLRQTGAMDVFAKKLATVYKGNIIKNLIMDCQSYTKYRPNETTGGIFVSWRRKEELPTGA